LRRFGKSIPSRFVEESISPTGKGRIAPSPTPVARTPASVNLPRSSPGKRGDRPLNIKKLQIERKQQ
jgi:hypothetical protein